MTVLKIDWKRLFSRKEEKRPVEKAIVLPEGGPFALSEDGKRLTFGRYPQSLCLVEKDLITVKPNDDGYLSVIGDGTNVVFSVAETSFLSEIGKNVEKGDKYPYKFEPIEWEILSFDEKEALLLSAKILDAKPYNDLDATRDGNRKDAYGYSVRLDMSDQANIPANNWEVSTLREWLNWDFPATCFNEDELGRVLTMDACESIIKGETYADQASILDVLTAQDESLGFLPSCEKDEKRRAEATDFAMSSGLAERDGRYGVWWVKDGGFTTYNAARVYHDGYLNETGKKVDCVFGVRPLIKVKL